MLRIALLLLLAGSDPVIGQMTPAPPLKSDLEFARGAWRETQSYLFRSAETAPDSLFAFKPSREVRSFGETLDHVAASERGYCQMALGQKPSGGGSGTGAKTKAEVIAALRTSAGICEPAYGQSDADAAQVAYGGGRASRLQMLLTNTIHDSEHYGNIVTYLRLNHLVPPSSQPIPR
jgi:uncharacterized damage-inducible protein DinB